ncbi:MAG TPA: ribosome biogenesis GTPase YqeH [Bacillota bacterium]|nr:ribosome biogenesis GTPase YqeH [Bacillota bacterium]
MEETIICHGCGARIQTTDPDIVGYAPESALKRSEILCKRCFRLKHYNELMDVSMSDDDYLKMIHQIHQKTGLIVHVVDLFDLNGSLLPSLKRIAGDNPVLIVANKIDLLPKSTNQRKLKQWIRSTVKELGIHVKDVCLLSASKEIGFEELKKKMETYRKNDDVYVIGTTNVGKSTLINQLMKQTTGDKDVITTSYFPGTTIGFIEIPLDGKHVLVDTPGIVNRQQITHYLSREDLKQITPKKEVKPRIYQITEGQTLFFGGLARIDIIKGEQVSLVCYLSNDIPIHRTKTKNADDLYKRHNGNLLSPPDTRSQNILPEWKEHTFKITEENVDVVFAGLGWICIPDGYVTIRTHYPDTLSESIRRSII